MPNPDSESKLRSASELQSELHELLVNLEPVLDAKPYCFVTQAESLGDIDESLEVLSWFREAEGVSMIVAHDELVATHADADTFARITLRVHSSLNAVGLTAAVAGALTDEGISANVVAAFHHDHIFVAWTQRTRALAVLQNLQNDTIERTKKT